MLDRLEIALARYEEIRSSPGNRVAATTRGRELSVWLDQDVCPVVEELSQRPDFRVEARWPIERLQRGSGSVERALVETVADGLVECASALAGLAGLPAVRAELLKLEPAREHLRQGNTQRQAATASRPEGTPVPLDIGMMAFIASRPWRDLVVLEDYFCPVSDLNLVDREGYLGPNSSQVQIAEFLPFCNPQLRYLGDFVARTLLIRIEHWQSILQRFWVRCQTARQSSPQQDTARWATLDDSWQRLQVSSQRLRQACLASATAPLSKACMALLQVHVCYRPRATLDWLGLAPDLVSSSVIRHRLEHGHDGSVAEQVAGALIDVRPLYRGSADPDSLLEAKCRSQPLVLVMGRGRREVYWQGQRLDVDWSIHQAPWDLLATLAERACSLQGADTFDLEGGRRSRLKDRRHRLMQFLPASLNEKIHPAGRGTYKLALRPEEICLLQYAEAERLAELPTCRTN